MENNNTPQLKDLQLREAQETDAPLLVSILHAAFAEYSERLDPPSGVHHETVESVLKKLHEGHALLAYQHGEAVGCVFYHAEPDHVYLGRLSVLPQHRGQGAARALIQAVEQEALRLNLPRVRLGVRIALPKLHALYSGLGYRVLRYGTHEGYAQPTYMVMEKVLEPDGSQTA